MGVSECPLALAGTYRNTRRPKNGKPIFQKDVPPEDRTGETATFWFDGSCWLLGPKKALTDPGFQADYMINHEMNHPAGQKGYSQAQSLQGEESEDGRPRSLKVSVFH